MQIRVTSFLREVFKFADLFLSSLHFTVEPTRWVFISVIVFCNLKFLLASCLCNVLFDWGFIFLCWEFLNCFICFKCVLHWTHRNVFMMVTSKSFSDNYCVCVISVLGSIVCFFLVKFIFFWSCYDKWKFWILCCKTLDLTHNLCFSRLPLTLLLSGRGGAASFLPGGCGSPSPPLGLHWHLLLGTGRLSGFPLGPHW